MTADVSQLLKLADELDAAGPKIARATVEAVSEAGDVGVTVGRAWAPRRTGDLGDSIEKIMDGGGGAAGARARVRAKAPYGWFVYAGTARQAPQPEFLDHARQASDVRLGQVLPAKVSEAMP